MAGAEKNDEEQAAQQQSPRDVEARRMVWERIMSLLVTVVVNYLTSKDISRVSDLVSFGAEPADETFSIWGLIYSLMMLWVGLDSIFGASPNTTTSDEVELTKAWHFVQIFNCVWTTLWSLIDADNQVYLTGGCAFTLSLLVSALYRLWQQSKGFLRRNISALYLGWCVGAFVLNMAIFINGVVEVDSQNMVSVTLTAIATMELLLIRLLLQGGPWYESVGAIFAALWLAAGYVESKL